MTPRLAADGLVADDIANAVVDAQHEPREQDEGPNTVVAEGATARHRLVLAERVQRVAKSGHVKAVA